MLQELGFSCHIGRRFCGAFRYGDDLALVAPAIYALEKMIKVCEKYALDYNMVVTCIKSVIKLCNEIVEVCKMIHI